MYSSEVCELYMRQVSTYYSSRMDLRRMHNQLLELHLNYSMRSCCGAWDTPDYALKSRWVKRNSLTEMMFKVAPKKIDLDTLLWTKKKKEYIFSRLQKQVHFSTCGHMWGYSLKAYTLAIIQMKHFMVTL